MIRHLKGKIGSYLNSEIIDSLASPLTRPRPSGFAIYVARLPSAPLYLGCSRRARPLNTPPKSREPLPTGHGRLSHSLHSRARHLSGPACKSMVFETFNPRNTHHEKDRYPMQRNRSAEREEVARLSEANLRYPVLQQQKVRLT